MKVGQLVLEEIPNGLEEMWRRDQGVALGTIVVKGRTLPTEVVLCPLAGSNGSDSDPLHLSAEREVSTRSTAKPVNGSGIKL